MSDYIFACVIPIVAIAIIFAWVPFLNFICPPCTRSLERRRCQEDAKTAIFDGSDSRLNATSEKAIL
jgi:hypothetical protein